MNTSKIIDIYQKNTKNNGNTLMASEWNSISGAVNESHVKINSIVDDINSISSGVYTKSEIDDMLSNVVSPFRETSEDGFFLTDSAGNIAFKYDSNGLDFAMLSEHAKQLIKSANELSYNVVDE